MEYSNIVILGVSDIAQIVCLKLWMILFKSEFLIMNGIAYYVTIVNGTIKLMCYSSIEWYYLKMCGLVIVKDIVQIVCS